MRFASLLVFASLVAFVGPARAAEPKAAVKIGGPFDVEVVKDIAYQEGDDPKQKLDLYLPKGQKDFPVLFFVHGGSWRSGDRGLYGKVASIFARNGVGMVVPSYRLSPKVKHPVHVEDVARAFAWTCKNIGAHGGRADQIFLCGHSAGGHLVSLLACDETYLKAEKLSAANVKAVIPISGVYTITPGRLANAFGEDPEICRKASPLEHVRAGLPPFLILYADKDFTFLDVMAENMHRKLSEAKVDSKVVKLKDKDHYTIIRGTVNQDDPVTQAILSFVAQHAGLKLTDKEAEAEPKP